MFPRADIPVVELSMDENQPPEACYNIGRRLMPLRKKGVLVMGSGNVVHNLGRMDWAQPDGAYGWSVRVDDTVRTAVTSDPVDLPTLESLPATGDGALAIPSAEHYLPLAHLAGMAAAEGEPLRTLTTGIAYGSVSMASYVLA